VLTLNRSVGSNGANIRDDVHTVQCLLQSKGFKVGTIDGVCGNKTIQAIRGFQASFLSNPDGLIEPRRTTWLRLMDGAPPPPVASVRGAAYWSGDSARWTEDKKIESLNPLLRPKVQRILTALHSQGFMPKVFYGWRSVAVQLEIYNQGHSKVKFSFHNAQKPDGTPNSYAADIVDSRYAWNKQAETSGFWKALGTEAKKEGLYWGGDWKSFPDVAHVQLVDNDKLTAVKRESGL
jgi:peptidoglycan L-alanyl-D-glutamate endopeptidase CwlK